MGGKIYLFVSYRYISLSLSIYLALSLSISLSLSVCVCACLSLSLYLPLLSVKIWTKRLKKKYWVFCKEKKGKGWNTKTNKKQIKTKIFAEKQCRNRLSINWSYNSCVSCSGCSTVCWIFIKKQNVTTAFVLRRKYIAN